MTDKDALEYIEEYYRQNNRKMTDNNLLQAKYLEGSISLPNESGMAVGSYYQNQNGPDFILLPGPPSEMRPMFDKQVMHRLKENYAREHLLFSRVLRFYGIGESQLVTELDDLINGQTNPTIAPYAKVGEVTLRLTAQADSKESAKEILDETEQVISKRVGQYLYGYGDDNSLPKVVVEKLKQRGLTVSASESLTGGSFQKAVTDIAGSSQIFPGGWLNEQESKWIRILAFHLRALPGLIRWREIPQELFGSGYRSETGRLLLLNIIFMVIEMRFAFAAF